MSRPTTIPTRRNTAQSENQEDNPLGRLFQRIVSLNSTSKSTSKSFLKSLQSIKLTPSDLKQDSNSSCSICMDDFCVGSLADKLPCKHLFHNDCIVEWLKRKNTCPLCRFKLPVDPPPVSVSSTLFRSPSDIDFNAFSAVTVTTFRTVGNGRVNQRTYSFDLTSSGSGSGSGSNTNRGVGDMMVDSDGDTLMIEVAERDADGDMVMLDATT